MSGIGHRHEGIAPVPRVAVAARPDAPLPWAMVTDAGPARRHNEDRWGVDDTHGIFVLADGMGGYNAGEVAAEIAVRTVAQGVGALRAAGLPTVDALMRAVASAHAGILEFAHARAGCLGMGTTVVAAAIDGRTLTIAHVGDSRAYVFRGGLLRRLTSDHSIGQQMLDTGRMNEAQVRRLPARGILTRALGIETESPEIAVAQHAWSDGDVLVLCTDGLTDALEDAAIVSVLGASDVTLATCARELVVAALARGCTDDTTVLLAGGLPAGAPRH